MLALFFAIYPQRQQPVRRDRSDHHHHELRLSPRIKPQRGKRQKQIARLAPTFQGIVAHQNKRQKKEQKYIAGKNHAFAPSRMLSLNQCDSAARRTTFLTHYALYHPPRPKTSSADCVGFQQLPCCRQCRLPAAAALEKTNACRHRFKRQAFFVPILLLLTSNPRIEVH